MHLVQYHQFFVNHLVQLLKNLFEMFFIKLPEDVSAKYPSPLAAVKFAVLTLPVCQLTVPDLPNPDCDAPLASDTVSPLAPTVIVVPD